MIGLLVWLIGAVALVYGVTERHLWHEIANAALAAGVFLWCIGGAILLSLPRHKMNAPGVGRTLSREDVARLAELSRQQQPKAAAETR